MPVFFQILILLVQLFPEALKAIKAWQEFHGQKLSAENRARLASDVKTAITAAVKSKDTDGLAEVIKNLGRPSAVPEQTDKPDSGSPSLAAEDKK